MSINHPTILVIEDEPSIQLLLVELLSDYYQIHPTSSGNEALELLQQQEEDAIDLILLDVMLPDLDGYEILSRFRDNHLTQTVPIPVIFITALNNPLDITRGLQLGAIDFITKPFDPDILLLKVNNHIQQKHNQDRLYQMGMVDEVTSVYNRRHFNTRLKEEWQRCMRKQCHISLLMIDIDYFKHYNDTYGHAQGDQCLGEVAATIQSAFKRTSDFVARYGGEEFAVILPDTNLDQAVVMAHRIIEAVNQRALPNHGSKQCDHITVSVGAATTTPSSTESEQTLITAADHQLYRAKDHGRNCVMPSDHLPSIQWGQHFSVGHPLMDIHHLKLVGYINKLIEWLNQNSGSFESEILPLVEQINQFAEMHFKAEEGLLMESGFSDYPLHATSHQKYWASLSSFPLDTKNREMLLQYISLLRDWWENHILIEDMRYKGKVLITNAYPTEEEFIH